MKLEQSSITWSDVLWNWLVSESCDDPENMSRQQQGRAVSEYVRVIVRLIKNETVMVNTGDQVVGVISDNSVRQLSAAQIKELKGKKRTQSGAIPLYPADTMGDLLAELKAKIGHRREGTEEVVEEMKHSATEIRNEMLKDALTAPDPPGQIKENGKSVEETIYEILEE